MDIPLEEQYLTWLYSQVGSVRLRNRSRTYWTLLRQLYTKEFVWFIPNDDNRLEDGRYLRYEFLTEMGIQDVSNEWMHEGCSMLEMLIGLSRRLAFETDSEPAGWFWKLIENLGLEGYNDNTLYPNELIDDILNSVIFRTYKRNGDGGLFPLRHAHQDQRNVEIWYQLNAYLLENY